MISKNGGVLNEVLGTLSVSNRFLVWDSFRCHISDATKSRLKKLKVDQAPDVSWNSPFKTRIREKWDSWMARGEKTFTKGGNKRAPTRLDQVIWVKEV